MNSPRPSLRSSSLAAVHPLVHALVHALWLLPRRALAGGVLAYRYLLKPWLGNACRFEPTCSAYALQALRSHGAVQGSALAGWRLLRCQPWCDGGCDPVPPPGVGLFTRWLPAETGAASAPSDSPDGAPPSFSGAAPGASPVIRQ